MRKRVRQGEDYINELAESIERERAVDPDVILPWEWWKAQAESYGVTPNNIYSRAISKGLYTPPSRRVDADVKTPDEKGTTPSRASKAAPEQNTPSQDFSSSDEAPLRREAVYRAEIPSTTQVLTEKLQAMVDVAGMLGDLEKRIGELEREKEAISARQRETLRALDRLSRVLEEAVGTVNALKKLHDS